jgi:NADH dehydrogenase FAD-containing subunit
MEIRTKTKKSSNVDWLCGRQVSQHNHSSKLFETSSRKRPEVLKADSFGSILVMGDAAAFEKKGSTFLPQNAQVAGQQGAFTGRLLNRGFDLTTSRPPTIPETDKSPCATWAKARGMKQAEGFDFLNLGLLAYLGGNESLVQAELGEFSIFHAFGSDSFYLMALRVFGKTSGNKEPSSCQL